MFGINVIEVAIGLVLAYLIFSSICSGLFELFANVTNLRARHLEDGLKKMLHDPKGTVLVNKLYEHHLISTEFDQLADKLQHVGTSEFATALMDILAPDNRVEGSQKVAELKAKIQSNDLGLDPKLQQKLLAVIDKANGEVTKVREGIEQWFDHSMNGLSRWYRKRARGIIIITSFLVVVGFNADTVRMARVFWNDDELRQGIVNASEAFVADHATSPVKYTVYNVKDSTVLASLDKPLTDSNAVPVDTITVNQPQSLDEMLAQLDQSLNSASILPVGWDSEKFPKLWSTEFWQWLGYKFVGLVFTMGAVTLGAPYWFDLLKRLLGLRQAMKQGTGNSSSK